MPPVAAASRMNESARIDTEIRGTELDNLQKFQQALMPASMRQQ